MRRKKFTTPDRIIHPVTTRASRALIGGPHGDLPKVALQFTDAEGKVWEVDLDLPNAARLIEEATAAYHAIVPVLRTSRSGWGA